MLLKLKLVLLSCLLTLPSVAAAQNHNVIITGFGFFPQVTYVKPGDMVYFKNDAGFTHRLSGGQNTRNPWSVVVEPYQTVAMRVTLPAGLCSAARGYRPSVPTPCSGHADCALMGEEAALGADGFDCGFFLIAPHVLYRDRRHPAPELYAPLTGPHGWRFGPKKVAARPAAQSAAEPAASPRPTSPPCLAT
jgi:hypothetical protein